MFGLGLMLISGLPDTREEDKIQSSEEDTGKKSMEGEHKLIHICGDLCEYWGASDVAKRL